MDFWHAGYHENINMAELGGAFVAGGTGTALVAFLFPAVPAFVEIFGGGTVATIIVETVVGAGASTVGEFTGRVWQNSMCEATGCPIRDDLWDVSTYRDDLLWGAVTSLIGASIDEIFIKPKINASMAQAEAAAKAGFQQQAASQLWDHTLATGESWPPQSTKGFTLVADWKLGPPAGFPCPTPSTAVLLTSLSEALDITVNDDIWKTLWSIMTDE